MSLRKTWAWASTMSMSLVIRRSLLRNPRFLDDGLPLRDVVHELVAEVARHPGVGFEPELGEPRLEVRHCDDRVEMLVQDRDHLGRRACRGGERIPAHDLVARHARLPRRRQL